MKCLAKHLCCLLLACGLVQSGAAQAQGGETWLLVDTVNLRLMVMQGTRVVHTYEDISIGRDGVSREKIRGDQRTPVGRFRIAWVREASGFHRFLGLDYPDRERARAHENGKIPPQGTPLGGQIGIHGIGEGDPEIHDRFNWTNGCVAITNEQLDELMQWVHIGTRVDIR
jgi:murein L,D-transpeptidase YafK